MWWCSGECCLVASPQPDDLSDIDFYVDHFDTQMTEKYSTAICSGGMWWPRPRQLSCSLQSHPGLPPIPPLIGLSLFIRGLSIFIRSLSLYKRPLPNSDPLSQTAQNHCSTSIGVKKEVSASIASCVSQLPHTLKSDTLVRVSPRNTLPSLFEPHLWSRLVTESEHLTTQVFVG